MTRKIVKRSTFFAAALFQPKTFVQKTFLFQQYFFEKMAFLMALVMEQEWWPISSERAFESHRRKFFFINLIKTNILLSIYLSEKTLASVV